MTMDDHAAPLDTAGDPGTPGDHRGRFVRSWAAAGRSRGAKAAAAVVAALVLFGGGVAVGKVTDGHEGHGKQAGGEQMHRGGRGDAGPGAEGRTGPRGHAGRAGAGRQGAAPVPTTATTTVTATPSASATTSVPAKP